jgi:diketogulonate reductase-like aldo/keto reductase
MVNQCECHPLFNQAETREYCQQRGIVFQSYSPLMRGHFRESFPALDEIAARHGKSKAQVILRWHLQHGACPIPKTVSRARMAENIAVFDFELTDQDMARIDGLEDGRRWCPDADTWQI